MKKLLITLLLTGFMFTLNSCKTCHVTPKGLISESEAATLEANFVEKKRQIENGSLEYRQDCREFWWSIEELENYICYAKAKANEKGKLVNGFRIYLGAYPLEKDSDKIGLNTIFMVPTEKKVPSASIPYSSARIIENSNDNENIYGIQVLDYAGGGNPPKAYN